MSILIGIGIYLAISTVLTVTIIAPLCGFNDREPAERRGQGSPEMSNECS